MSAPSEAAAELSSKKRKLDNDDRADRKRAKKQRRAEARERIEAEAARNGENASSQVAVNDSEKQKRKRKRKHWRLASEAEQQDDEPTSNPQPDTTTQKKKKRKHQKPYDLRKPSERKSTTASKEALRAGKPSAKPPNLPQDKLARIQAWSDQSESETSKVKARKEEKKRLKLEKSKPGAGWTLSATTAGRYLDQDPIFVRGEDGEEFLVSANQREMLLLSLETSLIVRSAPVPKGRSVRCFASAATNDGLIRVGLDDGSACTWDWESDGEMTSDFKAPAPLTAMAPARISAGQESKLVYLRKSANSSIYIEGSEEPLFSTEETLSSIQTFGNADYIIASGPSAVVIGTRKEAEAHPTKFTWTLISLSSKATCIDGRLLATETATKKTKPQKPGLSLAIGCSDGQIHLYDDVSSISGQKGKPQLPAPRVLHWHREAVSSVKLSQDGNYLISGGKETVLVIWQLQTAKKQFLPHLTSTIERVVVNPKGDRYALQMGDNSIMVLSTSELKPVANFAGLQMSQKDTSVSQAATLHPRNPSQIILSVPSTRPNSISDITSRAFLQSFDFSASRHVARQALTRNNVTDFNLGPEGQPIFPPDANHVAISHDGSWLATVDEWMPPANDLEHLASNDADLQSLRQSRREVYLKFWKWEESENLWTLTTRADSPSAATSSSMGAGRILALIPDPSSNAFASIGEDCCIKIWKPKKRKRHGVTITDRSDTELVSWSCKRSIPLPRPQERVDSPFISSQTLRSATACLSYAADGSMLAAALSTPANAMEEAQVVYFVNPVTGETIPRPGLTAHETVAMGFLDQYFIAVDRLAAYVWDLINERVIYKVKLSSKKKHFDAEMTPSLTIDTAGSTFALLTRVMSGKMKMEVYGPKEPRCLFETTFKTSVEAVLATDKVKGYTLLFSDATIRTLAPAASVSAQIRRTIDAAPTDTATQPAAIEPAVQEPEEEMDIDTSAVAGGAEMEATDEDDRPVVRPEQLANIFDTPQSFALPPVREMFAAVTGLFSRRPFSKPVPEAA